MFWFDNDFQIESNYRRKILVFLLKLISCVYTRCYSSEYDFSCILLNCLVIVFNVNYELLTFVSFIIHAFYFTVQYCLTLLLIDMDSWG